MENAGRTIWVTAVLLSVAGSPAFALLDWADGATHPIYYVLNDDLRVDYTAPGMQTTVNLLAVGSITGNLDANEDSRINILGGAIGQYLAIRDRSRVDMSDGSIGWGMKVTNSSRFSISGGLIGDDLLAGDSSRVSISGGSIAGDLSAFGNSQVDISGGSISDDLLANFSAVITIHGSDFAVNGYPFGNYVFTSIYGGNPDPSIEPLRHLTGTLASGELIATDFYIGHDAKIVLVPTPGAFLLGSMGVAFVQWLRRRRAL